MDPNVSMKRDSTMAGSDWNYCASEREESRMGTMQNYFVDGLYIYSQNC